MVSTCPVALHNEWQLLIEAWSSPLRPVFRSRIYANSQGVCIFIRQGMNSARVLYQTVLSLQRTRGRCKANGDL